MFDIDNHIKTLIRNIPDYKQGIVFRDITPVLEDWRSFHHLIHHFGLHYSSPTHKGKISKIVAIEARGFIFGSALAFYLGVGLVLVRKAGKLPWHTNSQTYKSEYSIDTVEMHTDSINVGEEVVICDDILATGETTLAAIKLVEASKGYVRSCAYPFKIDGLEGEKKLQDSGYSIYSYLTL